VAVEAAAGGVADRVDAAGVIDPRGHRRELLGGELGERDREQAVGGVRIERAAVVGQGDQR
jgi:hypothetical protein